MNYSIITIGSNSRWKQISYNGAWYSLCLKEALHYFWLSSSLGFPTTRLPDPRGAGVIVWSPIYCWTLVRTTENVTLSSFTSFGYLENITHCKKNHSRMRAVVIYGNRNRCLQSNLIGQSLIFNKTIAIDYLQVQWTSPPQTLALVYWTTYKFTPV